MPIDTVLVENSKGMKFHSVAVVFLIIRVYIMSIETFITFNL